MLAPCTIHTHLPRSAALMFSREDPSHGRAPSPYQSRLGSRTCSARKRAPSSPVAPVATRASQPAQAPRASQPAQAPPLVSVWARPLQWDLLLVLSARVSGAATTKTSGDPRPVMAGPGPKCTAARLAVAWTVPAGSGPGPANAGPSRPPAPCRTRASPQLAHLLPPRPIGSDAVAVAVGGGRVRPLSPRHGISSVPRELRALSTLV